MVIYNVTVKIENESHDEWLKWMRQIHIPEVMATGCFREYRMSKVLIEDPDGTNYSIQYLADSLETLGKYQDEHAPALQKAHTERYKDKFVAFRTILELIDSGSSR